MTGVRNQSAVASGTSGEDSPTARDNTGPGFGYGGQHADRQAHCCARPVAKASFFERTCAGGSRGWWAYARFVRSRTADFRLYHFEAYQALARNAGLEPATLRVTVVCSTFELISKWRFKRSRSVHALRFQASARQPGIQRTRSAERFSHKHRYDGRAVETGHPGQSGLAALALRAHCVRLSALHASVALPPSAL